jgi:hypothetical protein
MSEYSYPTVVPAIARTALVAVELGGMAHEDAVIQAAKITLDMAKAARSRTGIYAREMTTETLEEIAFHGSVARDILDGSVRPSVGNVRQAVLEALKELQS